jgi:hypothetical protein
MRPIVLKLLKRIPWLVAIATGAIVIVSSFVLERLNVPPRELSPYIERRASGHNPFIVDSGVWLGQTLLKLDRGEYQTHSIQLMTIGAQPQAVQPQIAQGNNTAVVLVSSPAETIEAIAKARPGDVITLLPGTYRFDRMGYIQVSQPGSETARITVRAENPNTVFLEFNMLEGFKVSAPYWTFENLHIQGVCQAHGNCEHAFHIVSKATHFIARNNTIVDFNAHFKINAENQFFPDYGLIEGNTLTNSGVRNTDNPVSPIDLVAASHWLIRHNLITDFVKALGNKISYGAFAKGAGSDNRIEQNVVICEDMLQDIPGQRVGISLGAGGTGKKYCRDQRCIAEQYGSVIQSNLIASCSDDGIYINRAAATKIVHNSLMDTGGITVRFVESSADVQGNLVDGLIRARDGGLLRATDNFDTSASRLYLGLHPVRNLYVNSGSLVFNWSGQPPRRNVTDSTSQDLCGVSRSSHPVYGAFEDFSACLITK